MTSISPNRGSEWGSDGLVRGSGVSTGSAAPRLAQVLLAGIANGDLCCRLVYTKRSPPAVYSSFYNEFGTLSGQSLPGPPQASCLPDGSQMAPRWLPDVLPRCLPDVCQMYRRRCLSHTPKPLYKMIPACGSPNRFLSYLMLLTLRASEMAEGNFLHIT